MNGIDMEETNSPKDWVYVIISDKGNASVFLGLHDQDKDIDFIPAFKNKDDANDCFLSLPREKGEKYEVQAIHVEELYEDAKNNGFTVAFVDGHGTILKDN